MVYPANGMCAILWFSCQADQDNIPICSFGDLRCLFSLFRGLRRLFSLVAGPAAPIFPFCAACGACFFGFFRLTNSRSLQLVCAWGGPDDTGDVRTTPVRTTPGGSILVYHAPLFSM